MAKSKYHEEHPEEYTKYNRGRTQKYRWENPDKVRQWKENQKKQDAIYREEHRDEKNTSERLKRQESMKNATNSKAKWSDKEIISLKQMIEDGLSYTDISKKLGRSINSVSKAKSKYLPDLITANKTVNYIPKQ